MSAALSTPSLSTRGAFAGLLVLLASLGRAVRFPFDTILAGMVTAGVCIETLCELLELTRSSLEDHIIRLGLRSPNDKPARRRSARSWCQLDEQKALAWRAAGIHPEAIGANLGKPRSANAVRTKLHRMGQARPPRKELFRPDPAFFAAFSTGWTSPVDTTTTVAVPASGPADSCGRAAGPAVFAGAPTGRALVANADTAPPPVKSQPADCLHPGAAAVAPAKRAILPAETKGCIQDRGRTNGGRRELVVGGSEHDVIAALRQSPEAAHQSAAGRPLPAPKPIPSTYEEVDFDDLSWIASVKRPLTHKPTVYAVGMLMMCGLHYRVAAKLVGKTVASFRTLRTRMGVPVDRDRKKIVQVFDMKVANATKDCGGWIVAKSLNTENYRGPALYFWKRQANRNTHLSPVLRARDPMFSRQPPEMTIVTPQMLDAQSCVRAPRSQTPLPGYAPPR